MMKSGFSPSPSSPSSSSSSPPSPSSSHEKTALQTFMSQLLREKRKTQFHMNVDGNETAMMMTKTSVMKEKKTEKFCCWVDIAMDNPRSNSRYDDNNKDLLLQRQKETQDTTSTTTTTMMLMGESRFESRWEADIVSSNHSVRSTATDSVTNSIGKTSSLMGRVNADKKTSSDMISPKGENNSSTVAAMISPPVRKASWLTLSFVSPKQQEREQRVTKNQNNNTTTLQSQESVSNFKSRMDGTSRLLVKPKRAESPQEITSLSLNDDDDDDEEQDDEIISEVQQGKDTRTSCYNRLARSDSYNSTCSSTDLDSGIHSVVDDDGDDEKKENVDGDIAAATTTTNETFVSDMYNSIRSIDTTESCCTLITSNLSETKIIEKQSQGGTCEPPPSSSQQKMSKSSRFFGSCGTTKDLDTTNHRIFEKNNDDNDTNHDFHGSFQIDYYDEDDDYSDANDDDEGHDDGESSLSQALITTIARLSIQAALHVTRRNLSLLTMKNVRRRQENHTTQKDTNDVTLSSSSSSFVPSSNEIYTIKRNSVTTPTSISPSSVLSSSSSVLTSPPRHPIRWVSSRSLNERGSDEGMMMTTTMAAAVDTETRKGTTMNNSYLDECNPAKSQALIKTIERLSIQAALTMCRPRSPILA